MLPKFCLLFALAVFGPQSLFSQSATVISENANLRGTPAASGKVVDISTADPSTLYSSPIAVPREPAPTPPVYVAPQRTAPARTPSSDRSYIRGPRGGCYYYGSSGRKVYVDRSLCN